MHFHGTFNDEVPHFFSLFLFFFLLLFQFSSLSFSSILLSSTHMLYLHPSSSLSLINFHNLTCQIEYHTWWLASLFIVNVEEGTYMLSQERQYVACWHCDIDIRIFVSHWMFDINTGFFMIFSIYNAWWEEIDSL